MTTVKFYKIEMRIIYTYLWDRNLTTALKIVLWYFSGICFEISEIHANVLIADDQKKL
jgi:hypothetical protein